MFVEPLIPASRRYARMLIKDRSTADDLVQDSLEGIFTRWHLRRPHDPLRPWLFSILHNLAMSHFRRSARQGLQVAIEDVDEAVLALPAAQESLLSHSDVLAAIDHLPEEYRSVFLLIVVEELSYAEAASVLALPTGTIMSRLHRARTRLQTMLTCGSVSPSAKTLRGV